MRRIDGPSTRNIIGEEGRGVTGEHRWGLRTWRPAVEKDSERRWASAAVEQTAVDNAFCFWGGQRPQEAAQGDPDEDRCGGHGVLLR